MTIQSPTPQVISGQEAARRNELDVLESIDSSTGRIPVAVGGRVPVDGSGVVLTVAGSAAAGSAPVNPPVSVSGVDGGGFKRHLLTDTSGALQTTETGTAATGVTIPTGGVGMIGWISGVYSALKGVIQVSGSANVGSAPTAPPLSISGVDGGGLKRHILTDTAGITQVAENSTPGTGISQPTGGTGAQGWLSGIYKSLINSLTVVGNVAAGSAASGNPVMVGLKDTAGNVQRLAGNTNGDAFVQGQAIIFQATAVTRPNDTTAYSVGDLLANNTTAGSVTPITLTLGRLTNLGGILRRLRLMTTDANFFNATVRVHLFRDSPTLGVGDNGVLNNSEAYAVSESTYLGYAEITLSQKFTQGTTICKGFAVPAVGSEINFVPSTGTQNIFAILEVRTAVTPTAQSTFTLTAEAWQH